MVMHAVLTGDIVGSSNLSADGHRRVVSILRSIGDAFPIVGQVDVFSGDSWQLLLEDLSVSLRTALYLRACLKRERDLAVDSRVFVAWGGVDREQVNPARISESTGAVFTASGRGLDRLRKPVCMGLSVPGREALSLALDAAVALLDSMARSWSVEQARAVAETLRGRTQMEIAEEFSVGQSSINKSLQAAHWVEIEGFLAHFHRISEITQMGDNV